MVLVGKGGQIVMAGDPLQMQPLCFNPDANERGLPISMIQRLSDCYQHINTDVSEICFQLDFQLFKMKCSFV